MCIPYVYQSTKYLQTDTWPRNPIWGWWSAHKDKYVVIQRQLFVVAKWKQFSGVRPMVWGKSLATWNIDSAKFICDRLHYDILLSLCGCSINHLYACGDKTHGFGWYILCPFNTWCFVGSRIRISTDLWYVSYFHLPKQPAVYLIYYHLSCVTTLTTITMATNSATLRYSKQKWVIMCWAP